MKRWCLLLSLFLAISLLVTAVPIGVAASDRPRPGTGMTPLTPAQEEWARQNVPVIQRIRLNDTALERINAERQSRGLAPLSDQDIEIVPQGGEVIMASAPANTVEQVPTTIGAPLGVLPSAADNSASPAFPPVGNQGGLGACASWATTYYQLTYETNLALGRIASKGDTNAIFSPRWTYNMVNGGEDGGSNFIDAYYLMARNGGVSYADFPPNDDYLQWPMNPATWDKAINYRTLSYGEITGDTPEQLINNIKTQLANGHLAIFATYVYSWLSRSVGNDPSTNLDDAFVGQRIATYASNTNDGGHGMTIVGYNDNLWADLNANGIVDNGEKGAFKIVNSWGASDWNAGFRWVAYDALRTTSAVPASSSWPTSDRSKLTIFWPRQIYTLSVRGDYAPTMKAEVTLNHALRGQLGITLGVGETNTTSPSSSLTWYSKAVYFTGGNHAFDGSSAPVDGTFYFDFTDLASKVTGNKRWFVGVTDSTLGSPATIKSFKLYKDGIVVAAAAGLPKSTDANTVYSWVDYAANGSNQRPVADFKATPADGTAPLVVNFDGSASTDSDGTITSYGWNFGDGSTATGATVEHTYTAGGLFNPRLTVTDNSGATSSHGAFVSVVSPANRPPVLAAIGNKVVTAGQNLSFTISASDPDGDSLVFSGANLPFGSSFGPSSHVFSWTPLTTQAGSYSNIRFQVADGRGGSDYENISITVNPPAIYGQISGVVKDAATGSPIPGASVTNGFKYATTGTDGSYTLTSLTPGGYSVTASADGYLSMSQPVTVVAGGSSSLNFGLPKPAPAPVMWVDSITFTPGAQDMIVKVKVVNPSPISGVYLRVSLLYGGIERYYYGVTGTTGETSIRIYPATDGDYKASVNYLSYPSYRWDATKGVTSVTYTLSRQSANLPPVASFVATSLSGSIPLTVGFNASASKDPDGTISSYLWAFGDGTTGSGVEVNHTYTAIGTFNASLTVTDTKGAKHTSSAAISALGPSNHPPVLASIGSKATMVGQYFSLTLSASDADNDRLTYSASNLPTGAGFYAPMGIFYWRPSTSQIGTFSNLRFQVSDGKGGVDFEEISITVNGSVPTGTISGVVRDTSGNPLPGVAVTDGARTATTVSTGAYSIAGVQAGTYNVVAQLTGYATASKTVAVVSGQVAAVDFTLQKLAPSSGYMWVDSITFIPGPTDLTVRIKVVSPEPVFGASVITGVAHAGKYTYYSARTDVNGEAVFRISPADNGSYTSTVVFLSHPQFKWDTTKGTRVASSFISR